MLLSTHIPIPHRKILSFKLQSWPTLHLLLPSRVLTIQYTVFTLVIIWLLIQHPQTKTSTHVRLWNWTVNLNHGATVTFQRPKWVRNYFQGTCGCHFVIVENLPVQFFCVGCSPLGPFHAYIDIFVNNSVQFHFIYMASNHSKVVSRHFTYGALHKHIYILDF